MGLDASVMCTCYRDGKALICPFPDDYYIDNDGYPTVKLASDETDDEKSDKFDRWLASCCPHPYMELQLVSIESWKRYESFRDALGHIGWEQFPTLKRVLPEENHGMMPASVAPQALAELEHFRTLDGVTRTFLINSDTEEIIGSDSIEYSRDGTAGLRAGFDDDGFFIIDTWEFKRELFRARRFEQCVVQDEINQYRYRDLDTEQHLVCNLPVRVFKQGDLGLRQEYPRLMHIEARKVETEYYEAVLKPLLTIFQTAIDTGNPVRWS